MLSWMAELINEFLGMLLAFLPKSPFKPYISALSGLPFLGWLNWFIPVGACLKIMAAWLTCVSLFYVYSVIMRWVKLLGD